MYFIKAELAEGITFRSEITGENVYCTCPKCGAEVPVDLGAAVTEDGLDLYGTSVFCEACAKAFHAEQAEAALCADARSSRIFHRKRFPERRDDHADSKRHPLD